MRIDLKQLLAQSRLPEHFRAGVEDLRVIGEQLVAMQFQGLVFGKTFNRDACASYLADHIDAALELAERIANLRLGHNHETVCDDFDHSGTWTMGGEAIVLRFAEIRTYVHELKTLELAFTSKVSQARIWAERVQRYDPRLDRVAGLLLSGTHAFVDAGARQADTTTNDFNQSDPTLDYLRSRGLILANVVSLDQIGTLTPGYRFKVWGGVTLYDVAVLMHSFLDAADVHYSLYEPDDEKSEADVETAFAESVEENADDAGDDEQNDLVEPVLETSEHGPDASNAPAT